LFALREVDLNRKIANNSGKEDLNSILIFPFALYLQTAARRIGSTKKDPAATRLKPKANRWCNKH
jgi:hypothetical protein